MTIPMQLIEVDFYPEGDPEWITITAKLPKDTVVTKFARVEFVDGRLWAAMVPLEWTRGSDRPGGSS